MSATGWADVPFGRLLTRSLDAIEIMPTETYKQITVKLYHRGVVLRKVATGAELGSRQYVARAGQLIISRIDARNGAVGLVPAELDGAVVTNDFWLFVIDERQIVPTFLDYYVGTETFVEQCRRASEGTTNRVRLDARRFLDLTIPLPPLDKQRRIVGRIEEVTGRVEEARTVRAAASTEIDTLSERWLNQLLQPETTGWQYGTVKDVVSSIDAGWSPQCEDRPAHDGEWGVLKTTAVQWRKFRSVENKAIPPTLAVRAELQVAPGDVLVTRAGPRKRVGVVAAVRGTHPRLMISDKLIRLRVNREKIEPRFVELSLSSPLAQDFLVARKTGLADAQVNISQSILLATPIAYPSLAAQQRIVDEFSQIQEWCRGARDAQDRVRQALDGLVSTVLGQAFLREL